MESVSDYLEMFSVCKTSMWRIVKSLKLGRDLLERLAVYFHM